MYVMNTKSMDEALSIFTEVVASLSFSSSFIIFFNYIYIYIYIYIYRFCFIGHV